MPSNVKVFWWLSVAIVAYWAFTTAWSLAFPSAHYLAVLAKLPIELREGARRLILVPILATSFWCGVTLGLAWLAAFRKQNLARWAYALAFLFREVLLQFIVVAYVYLVPVYSAQYRHSFSEAIWKSTVNEWSNPRSYLIPTLIVIAIVAVFTGNAKDWFRAPRVAA